MAVPIQFSKTERALGTRVALLLFPFARGLRFRSRVAFGRGWIREAGRGVNALRSVDVVFSLEASKPRKKSACSSRALPLHALVGVDRRA